MGSGCGPRSRLQRHRPASELAAQGFHLGGTNTTHLSVADPQGGMVALTTTLNFAYGSGISVPGAGFLLNNEMDDFTAKPGVANAYGLVQGSANAIAPGKRPLSSMTPTLVFPPRWQALVGYRQPWRQPHHHHSPAGAAQPPGARVEFGGGGGHPPHSLPALA